MTETIYRAADLRSEVKGETLYGYAQIWGTYADLGSYVETFASTAFDAALADPNTDVRSFWNHDSGKLLGRQSAGTVKVWSDQTGLGFEVRLPNTSYANDIRELAERGDIGGVSVGFRRDLEAWSTIGGRSLRTHTSVGALVEVSPCSLPVYGSTTVQLRSLEHINTTPTMDLRTQLFISRTRASQKGQNYSYD